jgi:hypothetical protein
MRSSILRRWPLVLSALLAAAPWSAYGQVASDPIAATPVANLVARISDVVIVNGNPAIGFGDSTRNHWYVRANDSEGGTWGTPFSLGGPGLSTRFDAPKLFVVNGRPAIVMLNAAGQLLYRRASDADGTAWDAIVTVNAAANAQHRDLAVAIIDGRPAIAYTDRNITEMRMRFQRASDADGTTWGAAVSMASSFSDLSFAGAEGSVLSVVDGNPAYLWSSAESPAKLYFVRATNVTGTTWGTAIRPYTNTLTFGESVSLVGANGNPAVLGIAESIPNKNPRFARATTTTGSAWGTSVQLATNIDSIAMFNVGTRPRFIGTQQNTPYNHLEYIAGSDDGATWGAATTLLTGAEAGTSANYLRPIGLASGYGFAFVNSNRIYWALRPINSAAPSITSYTLLDPSPTGLSNVRYRVTFSEPVINVGTNDFSLVTTGVTGTSITSVTPDSGKSPGRWINWTVTCSTGTGNSGTVRLALVGSPTITDIGGTALPAGGLTPGTYTIDRIPPVVISINRATATPTTSSSVDFTVTFSETVFDVDAADFTLVTTGSFPGAAVTAVTGSGNTRTVTVSAPDAEGTLGLSVLGTATIRDAESNAFSTAFTTGQTYTIDSKKPTVAITAASPNPSAATSVSFLLTFSETSSNIDLSDFSLTTSGMTGSAITGISGSGLTRTITADTGSGEGTVRLDVAAGSDISDSLGNVINTPYTGGVVYTVDRSAPTLISIAPDDAFANASPFTYTATFSEPVTAVDAADFARSSTGTLAGITGPVISGSGSTRTLTGTTTGGSGTVTFDLAASPSITDLAGNPLVTPAPAGTSGVVDLVQPTVVSVQRNGASPTNGSAVTYTVLFSESMGAVNASNFSLSTSGVSGATIGAITGTGNTREVTVNTGSGSGTIRLDVVASPVAQDLSGNVLIGNVSGEVFTLDRVAPGLSSIVPQITSPSNVSAVTYDVTFNEDVVGLDAADFSVGTTGTLAGLSVQSIAGSGSAWTIVVNTGSGDGVIQLGLAAGATVADIAGNAVTGGTSALFTIDRTAPSIVSVTSAAAPSTADSTFTFVATFNEPILGATQANFNLVVTGDLSAAAITQMTGTGTERTFDISTGAGNGSLRLAVAEPSTITDAAGNLLSLTIAANTTVLVDRVAPRLTSIRRLGGTATGSSVASFLLTFNERVKNIDAADLVLAAGAPGDAVVSNVSGSSDLIIVDVNTGTGSGSLGIELSPTQTITDLASNPLEVTTYTNEAYTIDRDAPTQVGGITLRSPATTSSDVVLFDVTFSEALGTGISTANFQLGGTLAATSTLSLSAASAPLYQILVVPNDGAANGTINVTLTGNIVDAAGNSTAINGTSATCTVRNRTGDADDDGTVSEAELNETILNYRGINP